MTNTIIRLFHGELERLLQRFITYSSVKFVFI